MKKTVKIILLISLISLMGILSTKFVIKTLAETKYCASTSECFVNAGSGTESDPYQISTPEQLNAIRYNLSASYKLMNDIDLTYDTQDENGLFYNDGMGWEPIPYGFNGILDGNNYRVKGLYINIITDFSSRQDASFMIQNSGVIKNISFYDGSFNTNYGASSGIVHSNSGKIINVSNYNDIYSVSSSASGIVTFNTGLGIIDNSYNYGFIYANQRGAGIAIYNIGANIMGPNGSYFKPAEITNCFNAGTIINNIRKAEAGGIVVDNNGGIIQNVYNYGKVFGGSGIVGTSSMSGETNSVIRNAYNIGEVSEYAIVSNIENATLENVYYLDEYDLAGTIGENVTSINVSKIEMDDFNNQKQLEGFDYTNDWTYADVNGNKILVLKKFGYISRENDNFEGGSGARFDPWLISTPTQLNNIRLNPNSYYILTNNIDLTYDTQNKNGLFYNDGKGWEPISGGYISSFNGNLDGNGYEIIGLNINRPDEDKVGLFSRVDRANISDLVFKNGKVVGNSDVGMLAGYSYGSNTGSGTISNIRIFGSVNGYSTVGGLIGESQSDLLYIENYADITSEVSAGGIAGYSSGAIEYSFNVGTINGRSAGGIAGSALKIYNSYNAGNITGDSSGGIAGSVQYGEVKNCYNTGNVNSTNWNGALIYYVFASNVENLYNTGKSNKGYLFYEIGSNTSDSSTIKNVYYLDNNTKYKTIKNNVSEDNFTEINIIDLKNKNLFSNWESLEQNWEFKIINGISRFPHLKNVNKEYIDEIHFNSDWESNQLLTTNGKVKEILTPQVTINQKTDYNQSYTYLIDNNEIAKYNDGKIIGLTEGTTKITKLISLYDGYTVDIDENVNINVRTIKWESADNKLYKIDGSKFADKVDRYYYYMGSDEINSETILNDIKVNYNDIVTIIDGQDVKIYEDTDYLIDKIRILYIHSDIHDLNKEYLYFKNSCKTFGEMFNTAGADFFKSSDLYYDISPKNGFSIWDKKVCDVDKLIFTAGYMGQTVKTFDVVNFTSDKYDLTKDYIYLGTEEFNNDNINLNNGYSNVNKNNELEIKYDDDILETYKLIYVNSNKYDINEEKGYIYTETDIDDETILNNINLSHGEASIESNKLLIKYNNQLIKSFDIVNINSDKYDLTKEYIYIQNGQMDIRKINVTNGTSVVEDDKLLIKYGDILIKSFDVYNINFGELISFDKKITAIEEMTYEDFVSNITTNGVTYKIYNGEEEITTGNVTLGTKLKVYIGEELVDTYEITNEYLEISDNLSVNEATSIIEDLTVGQTVENIKENIDTTGTVKVVDQENNEVTDTVGTGYKVVIELSKETIEYTLVVNGDITGDGEIKMSDVMKAATQMIEENTIVGDCYLKAADVTGDGKIRMSDVMKLANMILEGGNN